MSNPPHKLPLTLLGIPTLKYRSDLPPVPDRMLHLPIDERGFPVPWFVHKRDDGTYDFRVIRRGGIAEAQGGAGGLDSGRTCGSGAEGACSRKIAGVCADHEGAEMSPRKADALEVANA